MEISAVLAAVAVRDLGAAKEWYAAFFGHPSDAEPMPGLAEWHTEGGIVQIVEDADRAGGSLVTVTVPDAMAAAAALAGRGGPQVVVDDTSSEGVRFATLEDPDGNGITIVESR